MVCTPASGVVPSQGGDGRSVSSANAAKASSSVSSSAQLPRASDVNCPTGHSAPVSSANALRASNTSPLSSSAIIRDTNFSICCCPLQSYCGLLFEFLKYAFAQLNIIRQQEHNKVEGKRHLVLVLKLVAAGEREISRSNANSNTCTFEAWHYCYPPPCNSYPLSTHLRGKLRHPGRQLESLQIRIVFTTLHM